MKQDLIVNILNNLGVDPNQSAVAQYLSLRTKLSKDNAELSAFEPGEYRAILLGLNTYIRSYGLPNLAEASSEFGLGLNWYIGNAKQLKSQEEESRKRLLPQFERVILPAFPNMTFEKYVELVAAQSNVVAGYRTYAGYTQPLGYYGRYSGNQDPITFKCTPEPLSLPKSTTATIRNAGSAIASALKFIPDLPAGYLSDKERELLDVDPFAFRMDFTIDENTGEPKLMEIQLDDSVIGLMAAETAIYTGQSPDQISAPYFIDCLVNKMIKPGTIIWVYDNKDTKALPSLQRFSEQVLAASNGQFKLRLVSSFEYSNYKPDTLENAEYVWDYSYDPTAILAKSTELNLKQLAPSPTSIYSSKKMLSILTDPGLKSYWQSKIGLEQYQVLCNSIINTVEVPSLDALSVLVKCKSVVVKIATPIAALADGAKGVWGPWDNYKGLVDAILKYKLSATDLLVQDYIVPAQYTVLVSDSPIGLKPYSGPARVCATVIGGSVTAFEVTISKAEPAKGYKDCVYTAII